MNSGAGPGRQPGYSLYELIITIGIAMTVLAIGVPSFSSIMARNRQQVEINALFHAIHLARKESIMRREVVSICPSFDRQQCQPGRDWSGGWIMFNNRDRDEPPNIDLGEPVLQIHQVAPSVKLTANRRGFTLRATFKRATNGTIVACDQAGRIAPKALVISYTGRPRVALKTPSGKPYSCAH
jgi:type IV fimbrial biogenesis protein FimT